MNWAEYHGGGSTIVGLLWFGLVFVVFVVIPMVLLYGLVRFIKWAWTD